MDWSFATQVSECNPIATRTHGLTVRRVEAPSTKFSGALCTCAVSLACGSVYWYAHKLASPHASSQSANVNFVLDASTLHMVHTRAWPRVLFSGILIQSFLFHFRKLSRESRGLCGSALRSWIGTCTGFGCRRSDRTWPKIWSGSWTYSGVS